MAQRTKIKALLALLVSATAMSPTISIAQNADDVVVMRRVIAPPKTSNAPEPTDPDVMGPVPGSNLSGYYWVVSGWFSIDGDVCSSQAVQTRLRGCVRKGESADPSLCPDPVPPNERFVEFYEGCDYQWQTAVAGDWLDSCSQNTKRPLSATCIREDGVTVSDSFCAGQTRPEFEDGEDLSGCTYTWRTGDYGEWESVCSTETKRRRPVACIRSDGKEVPGTSCPQPAPQSVEDGSNLTGCTFSWIAGDWGPYDSNCSENATRTRTNTCQRSDETMVDNALCDPEKEPIKSESIEILGGCGYEWVTGEYGEWSSTCSKNSERERDVSCRRSDGVTVANNLCAGTGPDTKEFSEITTSCTYEWEVGQWTQLSFCSANAVRTRPVVCRRSDGETVDDSLCSGEKAEDTENVSDFSGCQYGWEPGEWGAWDNTCSATANRTRTATCFREDGLEVGEEFCAGKTLPALTQQQEIYTGCERFWTTGNWSNYNSTCSQTSTRSRTVACNEIRPTGTVVVANGLCNAAEAPASQETAAIYTGCTNTWISGVDWGWNGVVGASSSTCDTQAQQTRTLVCQATLFSGTKVIVPDSNCTATKPATTKSISNTSTCTYSWLTGPWSAFNSTCSANSSRSRTVQCKQSDPLNLTVADTICTGKGLNPIPARNEVVPNVTDCTGVLVNPGFEQDLAGWTNNSPWPSSVSTTFRTGTKSARVNGQGGFLSQTVPTVAGQHYALSLWYYTWTSNYGVNIVVDGNIIAQPSPFVANDAWRQMLATFVGNGQNMTITLVGRGSLSFMYSFVDDVVLSPVAPPAN